MTYAHIHSQNRSLLNPSTADKDVLLAAQAQVNAPAGCTGAFCGIVSREHEVHQGKQEKRRVTERSSQREAIGERGAQRNTSACASYAPMKGGAAGNP